MKTKACSFFALFAIAAIMISSTPAAFADHPEVTIATTEDAMNPACEPECYTPTTTTVEVGVKVIFSNPTGFHSFTSGTMEGFTPNPSEIFDTGVLSEGESGEWTPENVGEVPFYCSLHPYMYGVITVEDAHAEEEADAAAQAEAEELVVVITDSIVDDGTQVNLEFSTIHVNYEIIVMQNGEEILKEAAHAMEMTGASHMIDAIGSDESPIDIEIVSLGIGPPGANQDWTGPTGSLGSTQVVPEFGTIAMMILVVAIISIVAVTAKSRIVPRF